MTELIVEQQGILLSGYTREKQKAYKKAILDKMSEEMKDKIREHIKKEIQEYIELSKKLLESELTKEEEKRYDEIGKKYAPIIYFGRVNPYMGAMKKQWYDDEIQEIDSFYREKKCPFNKERIIKIMKQIEEKLKKEKGDVYKQVGTKITDQLIIILDDNTEPVELGLDQKDVDEHFK